MKNYLIALLLFLLSGQVVLANTVVRTGDSVTIAENQSVEGAFYALGGVVALSGAISDDAVIIGGNVTVNGEVKKDLAILAGTVSVQAPVVEDLRIIAGDVTISKPVKGNLVVLAGRLTVLSTANISGDVLFYGGEGTIDAPVEGNILGSSDQLRINSEVKGGVDVITQSLTLGDQANVTGDVRYTSTADILRSQNAVVTGQILKNSAVGGEVVNASSFNPKSVALMLLVSLFTTLCLFLIKKKAVDRFAREAVVNPLLKISIGFGVIMLVPIAAIVMITTVLGVVIGSIILCTFILLNLLTLALMSVNCGIYFAKLLNKKLEINIPLIVIGALFLQCLLYIPIIGTIAILTIYLATLGGLVTYTYNLIKS